MSNHHTTKQKEDKKQTYLFLGSFLILILIAPRGGIDGLALLRLIFLLRRAHGCVVLVVNKKRK